MRVALYGLVVVAVVIGAGAIFVAKTGRLPGSGCRISSVDETDYVAGNRVILDTLPVYPGTTRRITTNSFGWSANDACLPFENSGPYDRYMTNDLYQLPASGRGIVSAPWKVPDKFGNTNLPARVPSVLVYYDMKLQERGWRRNGWSGCCLISYNRDGALLAVTAMLNSDDPYKRDPLYQLGVVRETG